MKPVIRIVVAVAIVLGVAACDKCGNFDIGIPKQVSCADAKPQG
jgi:hypothetical protein